MADVGFMEADGFVEVDEVRHVVVGHKGYLAVAESLSFFDSVFKKRAADPLPPKFGKDGKGVKVVLPWIGLLLRGLVHLEKLWPQFRESPVAQVFIQFAGITLEPGRECILKDLKKLWKTTLFSL